MLDNIYNESCFETFRGVSDRTIDLLVTDPPYGIGFMGSGTTALACQLLNRHYIGSEINKDYYDIAIKRISQKSLI